MKAYVAIALLLSPLQLLSQPAVSIRVNASVTQGAFKPNWAYFGYDEPNFTYLKYGRQLVFKLSAMSPGPVHIRTHNLLTTGDGTPALKWGSTNAYTENTSGRAVYDWTILDKIFDTYRDAGIVPYVEIGFMPRALSTHPDPYQHDWPQGSIFNGWAYPPKDYAKWAELVRQWVLHSVKRYGRTSVESWNWEVWNEPDIGYWQGTPEEYDKLYDYTVDAVKRALPTARVGGPGTTNPSNAKAAGFFGNFLAHCARGRNYVTGKTGAPLDFISFHAKGSVKMTAGHVQMDIRRHLANIDQGFKIVSSFPSFRRLPIVISESDPEGCAACSVAAHPENAYRNSSQYASYNAAVLKGALELAHRYQVNLQGVLTWAFEFEDKPYFAGYRALTTRDIDLPMLNGFRLFGLMGGERIKAESSAGLGVDSILSSSARGAPDINVLATRGGREVSILVWNYQDDEVAAPSAPVTLDVAGLGGAMHQVLLTQYQIDGNTSNAYAAWQEMGSPPEPSAEQHARLVKAGQLQMSNPPHFLKVAEGNVHMEFPLPSQGITLLQLGW
ncbi:MAG TPA: beta-xylosidase [Terriglobia bacterium]|nr:beta-xylosidase [Terriglobia bacterium]